MLESLRYDVPQRDGISISTYHEDEPVDDFNLNVTFDEVIRNVSKKSSYTNDEIKKVNELATIFLDTRKVLKSDHNIVDPIIADHDHLQHKSMSRSSIVRAEKVKAMMAIKYMYLQRQYDWLQSQAVDNDDQKLKIHPGIDGVYNPIQIIRNRKIRIKYHEYPKPMNIKTLPLACNVFSKYSKTKKNYKMLWSMELNELLQDRIWRASHIHELTNSNNQLWFPPDSTKKRHYLTDKLRDKIFDDNPEKLNRDSITSTLSDPLSKSSKSSTRKHRHKKITDKVKHHSKKLYSSNSSSNIDDSVSIVDIASVGEKSTKSIKSSKSYKSNHEIDSTSIHSANKPNPLKHQIFKPLTTTEHHDIDSNNGHSHNSLSDNAIPQIKIDSIEDINDIPIKSIAKSPEDTPELSEDENCNQEKCKSILAGQDLELNMIFKHYGYISENFKLKRNYLVDIYPTYTQKVNDKLDEIMDTQVQEIMNSTVRINDYYLQIFESLFVSFSEEISAVVHLTNDDHSVKIDNLLSTSDRSIGEINTSLTSEVRKVDERIDRLRGSFVDSCVMERCNDSSNYKMRLNENNYKTLYYVLESMIVITLRLVWVIVNIYNAIISILRFFWKIIKICLF